MSHRFIIGEQVSNITTHFAVWAGTEQQMHSDQLATDFEKRDVIGR